MKDDGSNNPEALDRVSRALGDGQRFRFLVEARRGVYLILLWTLHRRRLDHEMEVAHDALLAEVAPEVERRLGLPYDAVLFRQDLEQLRAWGAVTERIEPTRIRRLGDRGREKLLLRIDPRVSGLLSFLESQSREDGQGGRELGANLLADIHGQLKEATRCLKRAGDRGEEPLDDQEIERALHLLHEADLATERIAEELVGVGDALARFLTEPFKVSELQALAGHLERYVERYLAVLHERGRAVRMALATLASERFEALWTRASSLQQQRLEALQPGGGPIVGLRHPTELIEGLRRFFTPGAGLEALCLRINRRTREVIRRLQRHVEAVRLRNLRIETLRARTDELLRLAGPEADALAWRFVEELVAPVLLRTDGRGGTPTSRAPPPRPARRHESSRPAFRGGLLEEKQGRPGASRELELGRLASLCELLELRVFAGRPEALLSAGQLTELADARAVVGGLLAYRLRGGKARPHLTFSLEPAEGRALLTTERFELDLPDALLRRKRR
ncbi:MAG: DUF2397 family protein [Deltaproteobacteria bacterium]|nr:DUF2397 family protein [Deltaproteobacteria bacterium]